MDLKDFIYDFNLVSTLTVKDVYECCDVINNGRERDIHYQDCVSLYELVSKFNDEYLKYLKYQKEFKKIVGLLGKNVVYGNHCVSGDFTFLLLGVYNPYSNVFDEDYGEVYLANRNDEYFVSVNNGRKWSDPKYKYRVASFNIEIVKRCLDIVSRNNLFLEAYRDLANKFVFGNGTSVIFTKIEGDLFERLDTFTLTFGNSYMNSEDFIEVKFKLGDELVILYDESKVILYDEEIVNLEDKKKIIQELLSGIYVHSDKLNDLYRSMEDKKVFVKEEKNEKNCYNCRRNK